VVLNMMGLMQATLPACGIEVLIFTLVIHHEILNERHLVAI
jgi:hypothetical protein